MPRIEACLLDYGNTIVEFDRKQMTDLLAAFHEVVCRLANPIEISVLQSTLDHVVALPLSGETPDYLELTPARQMELLLEKAYSGALEIRPGLVEECDRELQDLFVKAIAIDPETAGFIERLSRSLPVGLVSNYPCGKAIRRSLEKIGILGYLNPVVISGEVGYVKPHRTPFLAALEELGVPPQNVLFVGDRWDADMIGARDVGMKTCHHVGFTSDRDLSKRYAEYRPDYTIERLEDLEAILRPGSP
jgi:HAD superfamily hydrolase (TIGR01549 family)